MEQLPFDLAAQQLVELLELVSSFPNEAAAAQGAVDRAAQVLDAEFAAVVLDRRVVHSVGFGASVPYEQLVEIADGKREVLEVPRLGKACTAVVELDGAANGHLVLARLGEDFKAAERNLLRGMGRILELSLQMLRTMDSLRQRQRLMEHLYGIQRSISRRMPLPEVMETVVYGVKELLGDEIVGLWLRDPNEPDTLLLFSSVGLGPDAQDRLWRVSVDAAGAAGRAIVADELTILDGYADASAAIRALTGDRLDRTMAAPVRENSKVTGSLFTAACTAGPAYTVIDQEILLAFAENVSLALTDAKTLSDMNEAYHDSLTGLASRALFLDRLGDGMSAAGRDGLTVALLFIDLDRFKQVNDTLGHAAGDAVLMGVAQRIQSGLRGDDMAARFGGDEFAVMLTDVTERQATSVAHRIISAVERPYAIAGQEVRVGASIGVAMCAPGTYRPDELMSHADAAMYSAKRNGRGRAEMYEHGMSLAHPARPVGANLRRALDEIFHGEGKRPRREATGPPSVR
jgi:diguanylate cyclase (GGDEF)-like protein